MNARERTLMKARYLDACVIDSQEFSDVAYEIRGGAVNVMLWPAGRRDPVTFAGTFGEMERLADELKEIVKEWRGL